MNSPMRWVGAMMVLALLAGCGKKDEAAVAPPAPPAGPPPVTVAVVKETERSQHFLAVTRHLELGGTLYGYADVDGDALKMAASLQGILTQVAKTKPEAAPFLKQELAPVVDILGLTGVKAVGLSSVPDGTGLFRNRVYFHLPDGRRGLLAGLGGEPAPFARLHLAPADTDFYSEAEIDVPAVYKTVLEVVAKVGGDASASKLESDLKLAGQKAAISLLSVVQNWKGRSATVLRMEEGPGLRLPPPSGLQLPAFSLLISVDGIAPALRDALLKLPMLSSRMEGGREIFELKQSPPIPGGLNPILVIEGSTLMLASSPKFLAECLEAKGGLAQMEDFRQALEPFGGKGNGLAYVTPRFFTRLRALETLNSKLPAEQKQVIDLLMRQVPSPERPLVSVRTNLPEGILVESRWNRSLKQDLAMIGVYNPVTLGLFAAMAVPAFEKVRSSSQEKAIRNNLRQLSAATDQYCLEHGVDQATYDQLVGPDKYIKRLQPVAGEDYRGLTFKPGENLSVTTSRGRTITLTGRAATPIRAERVQVMVLTAVGDNRVKVTEASTGRTLFDGRLAAGESKTIEKRGRCLVTVEFGEKITLVVDGKSFPVPVTGYGRFAVE